MEVFAGVIQCGLLIELCNGKNGTLFFPCPGHTTKIVNLGTRHDMQTYNAVPCTLVDVQELICARLVRFRQVKMIPEHEKEGLVPDPFTRTINSMSEAFLN